MKIFLVGASGMIGARILAEALSRGHEVIAGARRPERIAAAPGVQPVAVDTADPAGLAAQAADADVIVAAASPRSTGDAVAEMGQIGAGLMQAAKASGRRLVLVGGAGALNLPDGSPLLPHLPPEYLAEATGMKAVLDRLRGSDLDWTFFAPAALIQPGERTGTFRLGTDTLISDAEGNSRISAEDYAVALVDELETPAHRRGMMTVAY